MLWIIYLYNNNDCVGLGPGLKAFDPIYVNLDTKKSNSNKNDISSNGSNHRDNMNDLASRRIRARVHSHSYNSGNARLLIMAPEGSTHNAKNVLPFRLDFR